MVGTAERARHALVAWDGSRTLAEPWAALEVRRTSTTPAFRVSVTDAHAALGGDLCRDRDADLCC